MADRLLGKVALVTGAGSIGPGWGIGKATAVLFAREGARLVLNDRNPAAAAETAAIIREEGGTCITTGADVTKDAEVAGMIETAVKEFGRLDVLYNNVAIGVPGGPVELAERHWDMMFSVNLKSCFLTCKHALPVMEAQGGGSIVNVSSVASLRAGQVSLLGYGSSKAAMNQFTRLSPRNMRASASG
jgi:NAD(P)-dependent dehydrogenase (short-subunit alcohol dehydrogenase family)